MLLIKKFFISLQLNIILILIISFFSTEQNIFLDRYYYQH